MSPEVSIILTVYNMESCLRQTMASVVGQTFTDLEIICIDDGSTDASLSILQEYAAVDERIRIVSRENKGQGASRNEGLELAQGEYVMLLDADDIYDTTMVGKLAARAMQSDADVVVCRAVELDDASGRQRSILWTARADWMPAHDPFSGLEMADCLLLGFIGWPWDKLYKRSFIEENALRFPPLANSEDLYFVFLSLVLAQRISFVDEELIEHRVGRSGSVSNSRTAEPCAFYEGICMLKERLQQSDELWPAFKWGFLNWALDYTLWNIEYMADGAARAQMIGCLANGEFAELELDRHAKAYFNLRPDVYERYEALMDQASKAASAGTLADASEKHPAMRLPAAFFSEAKDNGWHAAIDKTTAKLKGQDASERAGNKVERGQVYFPQESQL